MDFNNETELDYEEDDLEDDCKKSSSEKKCQAEDKANEVNEDSNVSGVDDQYLQIDFTEDEIFTCAGEPLKTESCENQNVGKAEDKIEANDKTEETKEEKNSGNQRFKQSNNNENVNNNNINNNYDNGGNFKMKKKTVYAPLLRQWECNTSVTPVGYNWMNNPRTFTHDNQIPGLIQNFYPNQNSTFTLLNWITNQQEQNWHHIRNLNKSFSNYLNLPFVSAGSRFPFGNRKVFSGNVRPKKVEPHLPNSINSKSAFDKNLNNGSRYNRKNRFDDFSDRKANSTDNEHLNLMKPGIKNDEEKNGSGAPCYFMEEDEKKLIELKKEARLKRFVQEDLIIREKKSLEKKEIRSISKDPSGGEQKLILKEQGTQNEASISDNGQGGLRNEKPEINKESLLKKRNPFDTSVDNSCAKVKCLEYKSVIPFTVEGDILEVGKTKERNALTVTDSIGRGVSVTENDADPGVKFLRTVSKSFDELIHKTRRESQPSEVVKTLPFTQTDNTSCQNEDIALVESQLTGCIVKVLNVPPSITTRDVLGLCSPIGKVLEVKLNIPKENSAVIRFAESKYAEHFFSLYHGRKMNDYFLNVIVV